MTEPEHCPNCHVSLQGDPIPEEHHTHKPDCEEQAARYGRCYCLPYGDSTHFGRKIGMEIQGVYDGVLYWLCPDCDMAWPRWTDGGRLTVESLRYVEEHNAQVGAA